MVLFVFSLFHIIISLCISQLLLCLFNLLFFKVLAGGVLRPLQAAVLLLNLMGSSCAKGIIRKNEQNSWKNKQENRILLKDYLFIGRK